ncbi:hypothetical protein WL13_29095 [Burkholderia ubonensis]|nr:hypothetical protein WL13_29095 [Burkholderia ubonensis]
MYAVCVQRLCHFRRGVQQQPRIVAPATRQRLLGQPRILRSSHGFGAELYQADARLQRAFEIHEKAA